MTTGSTSCGTVTMTWVDWVVLVLVFIVIRRWWEQDHQEALEIRSRMPWDRDRPMTRLDAQERLEELKRAAEEDHDQS